MAPENTPGTGGRRTLRRRLQRRRKTDDAADQKADPGKELPTGSDTADFFQAGTSVDLKSGLARYLKKSKKDPMIPAAKPTAKKIHIRLRFGLLRCV
jgi:hypothetical protein